METNAFLRSRRVLAVKKEFVADDENSFWTFCVVSRFPKNEFGSGTFYVSFDNLSNSSEFDFEATFCGPIHPARIVFTPPDNRQVRLLIQSETPISGGRLSINPGGN